MSRFKPCYLAIILPFIIGCYNGNFISESALAKITFDLSELSLDGLLGTGDGLHSLSYEFCIPANSQVVAEIKQIDATIHLYPNSPGRIGCRQDQYLCIGDTHHPQWREILLSLAKLPYIEKIEQSWFESSVLRLEKPEPAMTS